jgi:hypothetical protein
VQHQQHGVYRWSFVVVQAASAAYVGMQGRPWRGSRCGPQVSEV